MAVENDIVLIHYEDKPLTFARIEAILPDIKRDWYHVKLLLLKIPIEVATWILRDVYIDGEEFTMGGRKMRLELVECPDIPERPDEPEEEPGQKPKTAKKPGKAKVISLEELRKSRE